MNSGNQIVKKGNKTKHLTEKEFGKIEALLNLRMYTTTEIGEMIGRSPDSVGKVAKKLGIEPLGQSKRTEEYKIRLANKFGDLADKMLDNIGKMTDNDLKKISLAQKIMSAGISTDKMLALTKPKEDPNAQAQVVNLTWLNMVQQNLAPRSKDGPPVIDQSTFTPPAEPVEDAQIVKPEEKNDGPKTNE